MDLTAPWQVKILSESSVAVELASEGDAALLAERLEREYIPVVIEGRTLHVESYWGDVFDVIRGNRMFAP